MALNTCVNITLMNKPNKNAIVNVLRKKEPKEKLAVTTLLLMHKKLPCINLFKLAKLKHQLNNAIKLNTVNL